MVKSPIETRGALERGAIAGLIAGIVLTLMMTLMSAARDKDIWYGIKGASAPFFGLRAMVPGFDSLPVVIGLICHLAISAGWGALFGVAVAGASRTRHCGRRHPVGLRGVDRHVLPGFADRRSCLDAKRRSGGTRDRFSPHFQRRAHGRLPALPDGLSRARRMVANAAASTLTLDVDALPRADFGPLNAPRAQRSPIGIQRSNQHALPIAIEWTSTLVRNVTFRSSALRRSTSARSLIAADRFAID